MVLRRGADQRGAADIDVLDAVLRLERIQIDRDQIDRRDTVLRHLGKVFRVVAPPEDAAVDLRQ